MMFQGGSMENNARRPEWLSPTLVLTLGVLIAVLAVGFTGFIVVDQTEEAVITRFGKYNRTAGPDCISKFRWELKKAGMFRQNGFKPNNSASAP